MKITSKIFNFFTGCIKTEGDDEADKTILSSVELEENGKQNQAVMEKSEKKTHIKYYWNKFLTIEERILITLVKLLCKIKLLKRQDEYN